MFYYSVECRLTYMGLYSIRWSSGSVDIDSGSVVIKCVSTRLIVGLCYSEMGL